MATEGFRLAAEMIGATANGPDGFVHGGQTYIEFALTHRGYFEVMFRPNLYRGDDADLVAARAAALEGLYGSARASLQAHRPGAVTIKDIRGLVLAGWCHMDSPLALTANVSEHFDPDTAALAAHVVRDTIAMGELAQRRPIGNAKVHTIQRF